jgi:hypothetical protein
MLGRSEQRMKPVKYLMKVYSADLLNPDLQKLMIEYKLSDGRHGAIEMAVDDLIENPGLFVHLVEDLKWLASKE